LGENSDALLTGEQFKAYVSDLRVKSNVYKQRRAELNDLKAEYGILSRTLEILRAQEGALSDSLDRIETQQGVRGFRETRDLLERISDEKANTDEEKGRTLEEMSNLVRLLNSKINDKKVALAPLLRGLSLAFKINSNGTNKAQYYFKNRITTSKTNLPRNIARIRS
jgi:intraflagellar transport protein 81